MERTQRMLPAILLFLLLLTTSGMGPRVVEARTCASQSQRFKGRCASSTNCANVCLTEGFTSGECRGHLRLFRQCFCTKYC